MGVINASDNEFPKVIFVEGAAPGTPPSGFVYVYAKSADSLLYWKDDTGTEHGPVSTGDVSAHLADTSDAHDASAISFSPTGTIASTDVQAAIAEVAAEAAGGSTDPTIPTGGTLYAGTSTSGWTSFGSPDTFDADTTIAGHFYLRKASIGNNLVGAYRAVGSFPKTYTCKVSDAFLQANYHGAGLLIGEASPGKYWSWFVAHDGAVDTARLFQRYAWTNATSAGANTNYNTPTQGFPQLPAYLRIVVNSSTDIELWASMTGLIYYRLAAAQNPSFTIGVFGFGINGFGSIEMRAAFDWIHES